MATPKFLSEVEPLDIETSELGQVLNLELGLEDHPGPPQYAAQTMRFDEIGNNSWSQWSADNANATADYYVTFH